MGFLFFWSQCEEFIEKWSVPDFAGTERSAKQGGNRALLVSAAPSCIVSWVLRTETASFCSAKADGFWWSRNTESICPAERPV